MPRVLIAGCGYVGTAAARIFDSHGWEMTAWARSPRSAPGLTVHPVDLTSSADVSRNKFQPDVVVHCASSGGGDRDSYRQIYRDGVLNLAHAFPAARLIFTSSTSVYGQGGGEWVTEESAAQPRAETGLILREAEEIVLAHGGVALRLAGIYGPGRSHLLRIVRENRPIGSDNQRWVNQIHRDDVAEAIFWLAREKKPSAQIYNVADDHPALRMEILRWLSTELGLPLNEDPGGSVSRRRGDSNKRVSNSCLRSLGWRPRFPDFRQAFTRSILPAES